MGAEIKSVIEPADLAVAPFDAADYLDDPETIIAFVEAALEETPATIRA